MPKIAIVRTSGRPVHSESYNVQEIGLAETLGNSGWICDVFMASPTQKHNVVEVATNVRVFEMPYFVMLGDQGIFPGLLHVLLHGGYDIVQVQEHWQITSILLARQLHQHGIPVVLNQGKYEDNSGPRRLQILLTDMFGVPVLRRHIQFAICKTRAAEAYLHSKAIFHTGVLPIGLDHKPFLDCRTEYTRKSMLEECQLLYVGNVRSPRRDVPFLIDLVIDLIQMGVNAHLTVIGDGPDLAFCKARVMEHASLGQHFKFTGKLPQSALPEYYSQSHLFLLPTRSEIYGMVVLESMYFGVPVIATQTAGPSDIITQSEDGFLLPALDKAEWISVIMKCYSDSSLYKRLAENAELKIRERFTWDALGSLYDRAYRCVLETEISKTQ